MKFINDKSEIIIPFDKIGTDDWDIKTDTILREIADNWNDELATPITESEIEVVEQRLGTTLPNSLKTFYLRFGIADIGEQLVTLDQIDFLKNIWAKHPDMGPDFSISDQDVLPYLVIFSDYLGNGNMFCFHTVTKGVYYFDHDSKPYITKMFDDVEDYIKCCLIFAQNDLYNGDNESDLENWTAEIVSDLVGKETVEKWRF